MELFDKRFVYLEWDEVLEGKKVFLADTLPELRRFVERGYPVWIVKKHNGDYPFVTEGSVVWNAMAYYDPNYECKVAYAHGKAIQCRNKGEDKWIVTSNPNWVDRCEYRVKPEQEMWTACFNDEGVISVMPASDWNKSKGRQLINDTEEECKDYAVENYCKKCIHEVSICCSPRLGCQGFKDKSKGYLVALSHIVNTPVVHVSPVSKLPVTWEERYRGTESECIDYMVDNYCKRCVHYSSPNCSMDTCQGFKEVKKRRMTNRELARWLAEGNGECMGDEIAMSCWRYVYNEADIPVKDDVQIRGWDETEWHEPEVEE